MDKNVYKILAVILLIFIVQFSQAQNIRVTGTIKDIKGEVLPGVSIRVKNTAAGTTSTQAGKYDIAVKSGKSILTFTLVGFKIAEVPVNERREINITLYEEDTKLNEVVVVGYGSVKKGDLTGSVGVVNMADLAKAPVPSFADALAGRVAGVTVKANDGQPGSQMNITVRGVGSLTQNVSPLFVVDGFAMEDFDLGTLSPDDVASISVLKDASSTAIYGARGSNGVIVIETKKGKTGPPAVRYNGSLGFSNVTKRLKMMDPYEFIKFELERFATAVTPVYFPNLAAGATPDPEVYKNQAGIDWQDKVLTTGITQIHNLSVAGGANGTKYLASGSYYKGDGTIINTQYNKMQGRVSLDQVISRKVMAGVNMNYIRENSSGILPSDGAIGGSSSSSFFTSAWGYRPIAGPQPGAEDALENELIDPYLNPTNDFRINPVLMAENEVRSYDNTNFLANGYLNYNITKDLVLTVRANLDHRLRQNNYFYNSKTRYGVVRPGISGLGVQAGVSYSQYNLVSNENFLTYKKQFSTDHQLELKAGASLEQINVQNFGLKSTSIPNEELGLSGLDEGTPLPNTAVISQSAMQSFFGGANYSYKSKYLFTASFRADGSSKFAPGNKWGYFPSGAFAWRMSDEKFMQRLPAISDAKLRISYGLSGNNRVGDFSYLSSLSLPVASYYSFNNQTPAKGTSPSNLGNSDLKWETSAQLDLGYDLSLFKNRIDLTVDVYRKTTDNLLLLATLPLTSGYATGYKNIGSIRNDGLEISLATVNIHAKDFTWSSEFNISFNKNKILSLNDNQPYMLNTVSWDGNYSSTPLYISQVGGPAAEFWGLIWDGNYQYSDFDLVAGKYVLKSNITTNGNPRQNIQPGDIKYKDLNGDLVVNASDRTTIGKTLPIHMGGFSNDFSYKGFKLNVFFQWSYGNNIFNANRIVFEGGYNVLPFQNQYATYADRWTPTNPSNTLFRAGVGGAGSGAGPNGALSSLTIEDGSYLKLKTVALEYGIPAKYLNKIQIKSLTLGVSAQNLYTWTKYSGVDPEVSVRNSILTPGFDFSAYPQARTIVFSIKSTF